MVTNRKEETETRKVKKGMRLGKYELGRILGEGNFGKVKYAKNVESGLPFAIKIVEKNRITQLNITDQIKREIGTLKLLKHPNVVRLHEVLASKTKIYMVLEYINGGELFDRISSKGRLSEAQARKLFQQLVDGVSYCHNKGVFHRDLKILKGEAQMPKWLSPGAKKLLRRILDPNPSTRITIADIKADEWFKQEYTPINPEEEEEEEEEEERYIDNEALSIHELSEKDHKSHTLINAFQLIGMSSSLDLSGFFENEDVSERKIRFTSNHSPKELLERIEDTVTQMGFGVQKKNGKLKVIKEHKGQNPGSLSVAAEVFEINPSLYVVELRKSYGDSIFYRQLCEKLSKDLGVPQSEELLVTILKHGATI